GMALAVARNYDPFQTTTHFTIFSLLKKFDKGFGVSKKAQKGGYGNVTGQRTLADIERRRQDRWNILFIAGMWFQDLWNYDFRRTEQCIIPYATQEGEISFCAYNTGIGWRNIIEKMHMTASLTKWYDEHGRHEIFAGGKRVNIQTPEERFLRLNRELITEKEQDDLDKLGIAKTARDEKIRARDARQQADPAYHARMAKLYRQVVLKEEPDQAAAFVPVNNLIAPATAAPAPPKPVEEPVAGD
ncbi:MAG TPA: radical SAM protein, partial [Terriglobales bacterium]|nr:radical SAM protein [Terriglobales bacterium]